MFCTRNPIFVDRRFNCPRKILKTVLESGRQKEKAILQFCSIFESRVKLFLSNAECIKLILKLFQVSAEDSIDR